MGQFHATPWPFVLPGMIAFAVTSALALVISSRAAQSPAVRAFRVYLIAQSAWSLGYVFELRAPDLESKLFWDNVQWLPAPVLAWAVVAFCFDYSGARRRARRFGRFAALSTAAVTLAVLVGSSSGSLRASARIERAGRIPALVYDFSVWDQLCVAVAYSWYALAIARLWAFRRAQPESLRAQTTWVLAGLLAPAPMIVIMFCDLSVLGQRDLGPPAFALGAALVFWGVYRYQLFDVLPIARTTVLDAIPDPVLVTDLTGRIIDLNRAALALGAAREPLGKTVCEAVPALAALGGNPPRSGQLLRARERALLARVVPVPDPHGAPLASAIVLRDVTETERLNAELEERVRARTAELSRANALLRETDAKLRAVFDGTNTSLVLLDGDGGILAANRTALALAGAEAEQVTGGRFADGPWWSDGDAERERLGAALAEARTKGSARFAAQQRTPERELRSFDVLITRFRDPGGSTWLIAEGRDVTELEASERQKSELARRLQHAERLEALGRLAGGVAHDFNNLLSVIMGNSELLAREVAPGSFAEELVADLQRAAASAATLTAQLLALSRRPVAKAEVLELDTHLASFAKLLRRLVGDGITLDLQLCADGARVRMQAGAYEQMVINLIVNAQEALGGRGVIRVRTSVQRHERAPDSAVTPLPAPGMYAITSVSDTGPGIPAHMLDHVFEPFFTSKETGTGLGLATVYALTRAAQGLVCLSSAPGAGTTVEIHLPLVNEAVPAEPATIAPPCAGRRVLVVEDNEAVRRSLIRVLERIGCSPSAAANAAHALELIARDPQLEVLLTDVTMPDMSGTELARQALELRPGLDAVFMSGRPPNRDVEQWLEKGARFVQKPFSHHDLSRALTPRGITTTR